MNKKIVSIVIISALVITMGAFSVFATPNSQYTHQLYYVYQDVYDSSGENMLAQVLYEFNASDPYIYQMDSDREVNKWSTSSNPSGSYGAYTWDESCDMVYASDITVYARIANQTDQIISLNRRYFRLNITVASYYKSNNTTYQTLTTNPWSIGEAYGCYVLPERQYFYLFMEDQYITDNRLVLTPGQTLTCTFNFTVYQPAQYSSDSISQWSNTFYVGIPTVSYETALQARLDPDIATYNPYYNVYGIYSQFVNAAENAESLTDQTESNEQTMQTIHDSESNFYQANSDALQAAGLSNYQFDSTTATGLGSIRNFMQTFWNNTSPYTSTVVTFSLMITLTTHILRHSPRGHKSKSSGSSGGKSNGSGS